MNTDAFDHEPHEPREQKTDNSFSCISRISRLQRCPLNPPPQYFLTLTALTGGWARCRIDPPINTDAFNGKFLAKL